MSASFSQRWRVGQVVLTHRPQAHLLAIEVRSPRRSSPNVIIGDWRHTTRRLPPDQVGPLGPFDNNAYVIVDPAAGEAAIVDMPAEGEQILEVTAGLRVTKILSTHTHPDHWFSYDLLKQATGRAGLCHPAEVQMPAERIDIPLADGEEAWSVGDGGLRYGSSTPPATRPGASAFSCGRYLIAGDTLFPGGPGHSDTPGDHPSSPTGSIVQRLYVLPDDTLVLPGHGDDTTIGASRRPSTPSSHHALTRRPLRRRAPGRPRTSPRSS